MAHPDGDADYLVFVDRKTVGVGGAKNQGSTLPGVEWQSAKYTSGLPGNCRRSGRRGAATSPACPPRWGSGGARSEEVAVAAHGAR